MTASRTPSRTTHRSILAATAAAAAGAVLLTGCSAASSTTAAPRIHSVQTPADSTAHLARSNPALEGAVNALELQNVTEDGATVTPTSSMDAFLTATVLDVDATWRRLFKGWGYSQVPAVFYRWTPPGSTEQLGCGSFNNDETFEYCSGDDTITISRQGAFDLWDAGSYGAQKVTGTGDMSVAIFVAHEYGHNIEFELGLWDNVTPANKERGADCFAGVWVADASSRGIVDAGDVAEALQGLDALAEHPGQSDGIHGTPEERQHAFDVGMKQGARQCVVDYLS